LSGGKTTAWESDAMETEKVSENRFFKEPWFLVQGFSRIYYRTSGPVPDPVLHI
jgi:hypothetical protein